MEQLQAGKLIPEELKQLLIKYTTESQRNKTAIKHGSNLGSTNLVIKRVRAIPQKEKAVFMIRILKELAKDAKEQLSDDLENAKKVK